MSQYGLWIGLTLLQVAFVAGAIWMLRSRRDAAGADDRRPPELDDALLRDAAHTLRTPLTVARSHAEFVLAGLEPGTPGHDDAVVVIDELRRAARISDQLLVLGMAARAEALQLSPVDTGVLALTVARRWSTASGREIAVEADGPAPVLADEPRLRDALDALVENALKACGPGDRITVGTRVAGGRVELSVSDTGPGIAPADAGRIFDRFARGAAGRGPHGTGLGLAIVRAIAEGHGGDVSLCSELGRGTTFTLRLGPVLRPTSARRRAAAPDTAPQTA
jgi:signal transduction histidine kinase